MRRTSLILFPVSSKLQPEDGHHVVSRWAALKPAAQPELVWSIVLVNDHTKDFSSKPAGRGMVLQRRIQGCFKVTRDSRLKEG